MAKALGYTQDVIVLLGDSLTQGNLERAGLVERLSSVYVRKLDVLNRGLSGYQTDWAIPVFEQLLAQHHTADAPKIQLLIIWFGANDAAPPPSIQHVPIARFKQNLVRLVNMARSPESPGTRIVLITPPPVNTHQWTMARSFDATKRYAEAVCEVGGQVGVPVVDLWTAVWAAAGRDEGGCAQFLHDGLHLNGAGYEIAFEAVIKVVEAHYPEVHYERLQTVFVPWNEVDVEDPRRSLVKRTCSTT